VGIKPEEEGPGVKDLRILESLGVSLKKRYTISGVVLLDEPALMGKSPFFHP